MVLVGGLPTLGDLTWVVGEALAGGADVIQLREKGLPDREWLRRAREVRILTAQARARFVLNDRPDLARLAGADGVHLGQDDVTVRDARRIVGPNALIGVSTHDRAQLDAGRPRRRRLPGRRPRLPQRDQGILRPDAGLAFVRHAAETTSSPGSPSAGSPRRTSTRVLDAGATPRRRQRRRRQGRPPSRRRRAAQGGSRRSASSTTRTSRPASEKVCRQAGRSSAAWASSRGTNRVGAGGPAGAFDGPTSQRRQRRRLEVGTDQAGGAAEVLEDSLGGEVAAADRPFHRRGPAGGGPVAGQEEAVDRRPLRRAEASTPGRTAKVAPCSVTTHQRRSFASRTAGQISARSARTASRIASLSIGEQVVRRADDELQVLRLSAPSEVARLRPWMAVWLKTHWIEPAEGHDVIERADRAVEPEVDAGDRRGLERIAGRPSAGIRPAAGVVEQCRRRGRTGRPGRRSRRRSHSPGPQGHALAEVALVVARRRAGRRSSAGPRPRGRGARSPAACRRARPAATSGISIW